MYSVFHREAKQVLPQRANDLCLSEFPSPKFHKEFVLHALPLDQRQNKFRQFIGPMEPIGGLCACSSARKGANVTDASQIKVLQEIRVFQNYEGVSQNRRPQTMKTTKG